VLFVAGLAIVYAMLRWWAGKPAAVVAGRAAAGD
jgi:hypothetical protein